MVRKIVFGLMVMLLVLSMFTLLSYIQPVRALETIYINADGSITPSTAPIYTADSITYTLTSDIAADADGIVIRRDNIVLDGAGYTVTGSGGGYGTTLTSRSNVTIINMIIQNFTFGIYLSHSYNNVLSSNIAVANSWAGIHLDYSPSNTLSGNSVTNNYYGIWIDYSSGNALSGNNLSNDGWCGVWLRSSNNSTLSCNTIANNAYGIWLSVYSSNDVFFGNNVTNNVYGGIYLEDSSNNLFYHNDFINSWITSGYPNSWDDGYPSGGNYWSNYRGNDYYSGKSQNLTGADGIGDTPYVIDAEDVDNYPLMSPYGSPTYSLLITVGVGGATNPSPGNYTCFNGEMVAVEALADTGYDFDHWELDETNVGSANPITVGMEASHTLEPIFIEHYDVAVLNVTLQKTVVGQNFSLTINVTTANLGDYTETFNVTAYANITAIQTETLTLTSQNSTTLTFTWNTTGFAYGNYALSAYAWPVAGETNTADNNFTDGLVNVVVPGDVDGNGRVNMGDISSLCDGFGATIGADGNYWHHPPGILDPFSPNLDIDGNGRIDMADIVRALVNFGQHYP